MLFINCVHSRLLPTKSFFVWGFLHPLSGKRKQDKVLFFNKISFVVAYWLRCVRSVLEAESWRRNILPKPASSHLLQDTHVWGVH